LKEKVTGFADACSFTQFAGAISERYRDQVCLV